MTPKITKLLTWGLAGLLALAFLGAGLSKLAGAEMHVVHFRQWGYPAWTRYVVGLLEIGMAVGLLWQRHRLVTLYELYLWAVGALFTHVQAGEINQIGAPILFAALGTGLLLLERRQRQQRKQWANLHRTYANALPSR